jgi:hypothetical protein
LMPEPLLPTLLKEQRQAHGQSSCLTFMVLR